MTNDGAQPTCRWCNGKGELVAPPQARPEWLRYQCRDCGTIAFVDMPNEADLSAIYEEAWNDSEGEFASGATSEIVARSMIAALLPDLKKNQAVLDYGAGRGALSAALGAHSQERSLDLKVVAFEPFGPSKGLPGVAWHDDLEAVTAAGPFDYIVLTEVIEHVTDPVAVLARLKQMLAPNGKIVITTPNADGLFARRSRGEWQQAQNPTHLNLFTNKSMDLCARAAGFAGFQRSYRPVRYKERWAAQFALSLLQRVGVDGGLRGTMTQG